MIHDTLQKISALLAKNNELPNTLERALLGDDKHLWEYLVSNDLWGGAGSVADQALQGKPEKKEFLKLMIELGREQINLGRVNQRTGMWVAAFEEWLSEGLIK